MASPAAAQLSAGSGFGRTTDIVTNSTVPPGTGSATTGANYANSPDVLSTGVNGVGQMISITLPFLNLCTGTLINPRTVITAAHCVYEEPKQFYGSNTGIGGGITAGSGLTPTNGIPISFGFEFDESLHRDRDRGWEWLPKRYRPLRGLAGQRLPDRGQQAHL